MTALIVSIIFTIIVLILSLLTISKGYGYKHTIDPISDNNENETNEYEKTTDK